jgi:hypothetical protein
MGVADVVFLYIVFCVSLVVAVIAVGIKHHARIEYEKLKAKANKK